jgi:alpha-beta hydrolase superfamily lysophospholipase
MREPKASTRSRREILKIGAIGAVVGAAFDRPSVSAQSSASARRTFVLVHGAYHGGWCWRRVADILEARGHKVYTPTLTGLGERSRVPTTLHPVTHR